MALFTLFKPSAVKTIRWEIKILVNTINIQFITDLLLTKEYNWNVQHYGKKTTHTHQREHALFLMPPSRQQPRGDMFLDSLSEACVNVSSYASICSETKVLDTYTTRHLSKQIKMFRVSFVFEMCFFFCLFFFAQNKLVRKSLNCIYSVLAEVYLKSAV